jgi:hypothetical protein
MVWFALFFGGIYSCAFHDSIDEHLKRCDEWDGRNGMVALYEGSAHALWSLLLSDGHRLGLFCFSLVGFVDRSI